MKRRRVQILLALFTLSALTLGLRHDLANQALRRGSTQLDAGDTRAAEAAFRLAIDLGKDAGSLDYNLGVNLYRKGEFALARKQFDAAIATAKPFLIPAAYFNRGNSTFRQAGHLTADDRQAAVPLYLAAIADYKKVLSLTPGAVDARNNLNLVQTRLMALMMNEGQNKPDNQAGSMRNQIPADSTGSSPQIAAPQAHADARSAQKRSTAESAAQAAPSSPDTSKPHRNLTPAEVERLLNDARGREKPAGTLHSGQQIGLSAQPDKDW
jgi:tetratricopeptide (TPR) repeat protein